MPDKIVPCDGVDCTVCDVATLAQNVLNTGIFIVIILSALLFAYAGWLYLSNVTTGEAQRARSIFTNVVIGLVIILGAWLVVYTLMSTLLGRDFSFFTIC